jgi:hypothetical protein
MRFIFNFIFFGILFYILWLYFPETFVALTTWAAKVVDFIRNLFTGVGDRFRTPEAPAPEKGLLLIPVFYIYFKEAINKFLR